MNQSLGSKSTDRMTLQSSSDTRIPSAQVSHSFSWTYSLVRTFIQKSSLPNLLFYGPPGTGKTSTMIACAKEMYGAEYSMMVLELNASDSRGIQVVRDTIKGFAETGAPIKSNYNCKIIILDEADSMTRDAQAALRRIMEKYSENTRFCLICNYVSFPILS